MRRCDHSTLDFTFDLEESEWSTVDLENLVSTVQKSKLARRKERLIAEDCDGQNARARTQFATIGHTLDRQTSSTRTMRYSMKDDDKAMVLRSVPPRPTRKDPPVHKTQLSKVVEEEEDPFYFSEFLYFCSNKFCLGEGTQIEEDEGGALDDSRNSIAKQRNEELDNNTRAKDDSWSCDSTLESSGIFSVDSPKQQRFRFFMDPKLAISPDDASVATLASHDEEKSLSLKERWDALYAPSPSAQEKHATELKKNRSGDSRSLKTEGGKPGNLWALSILESTPNCASFDSRVLGTSVADEATKPIVLTSNIMDALQRHLPYSKQGEMFWLKYSMVRDGANLNTVLDKTKRSSYTILAVETLDGEVFGAFTAKPWHITWKYYGTPESFLWRLRKRRKTNARDKPLSDGDFEVFRFAGNNKNIQLCHIDRIALGGGSPDDISTIVSEELSNIKMTEWGFGLSFGKDLQQGTSSPCMTFNSPSLSRYHADGSRFEVANMEFWTLTPCISLDEAKRMEKTKDFFLSDARSVAW